MAKNVFNPSTKYRIKLYGHAFTLFPEAFEPKLRGYFEADTVETCAHVFGRNEYAVFRAVGNEIPTQDGVYRIPLDTLKAVFGNKLELLETARET